MQLETEGMTFKSLSQFQILLPLIFLASGCSDPKPRAPDPFAEASPVPLQIEPRARQGSNDAPVPSALPEKERPKRGSAVEGLDLATLTQQFRNAPEAEKRGEIVEALWSMDTPAAVEALRQLFYIEREFDVKVDILAGVSDSKKPETRDSRFKLVVTALAPGQPKDVRELAAQMLVELDDPRAISLLQQYTQDADPDMREAASEALETRRAVDQP